MADESGRYAHVETEKLNGGSDKESIVLERGGGVLWHLYNINAALLTFLALSLPGTGRSLHIKMQ